MELVKVTQGGQVTIPAAIRRQIGIGVGDYLQIQIAGDHLVLTPRRVWNNSKRRTS